MKSSMEVSMSFCLSDLRKLDSEGAWAEIVDGIVGAVLWLSFGRYESGVSLEWWRYGMICLGCGLSDSGRGILKARDFMVEGARHAGVGVSYSQ